MGESLASGASEIHQHRFNDEATGPTAINIVTTVSPLAVNVDSNTLNYQFGGSGAISGSGALTKRGTSTLTILTDNNYTGGTTINDGTVNFGGGTGTGSLGSGPIMNDGELIFERSNNVTLDNLLSGTGTLIKRGGGTHRSGRGSQYQHRLDHGRGRHAEAE